MTPIIAEPDQSVIWREIAGRSPDTADALT